ncbi:unnamed protein product [Linum trigynum]|uniref:Uncharacterized protein n=1 Tax=Linum trigynum TaxID=586398 RepID=A0AAV2CUC4_9ROSI
MEKTSGSLNPTSSSSPIAVALPLGATFIFKFNHRWLPPLLAAAKQSDPTAAFEIRGHHVILPVQSSPAASTASIVRLPLQELVIVTPPKLCIWNQPSHC